MAVDKASQTLRKQDVKRFILDRVAAHPRNIAAITAHRFQISRQAAHRHVQALVKAGDLVAEGHTRARHYGNSTPTTRHDYSIGPKLEEHRVWDEAVAPILEGLPSNVTRICHYGVTEMVNNAIDHSESRTLTVEATRTPELITLKVLDVGVGIFAKIQRDLGLESPRAAILQLTKGKLTTDPEHHTGEGIFFTSRMFDDFSILSGQLFLSHVRAQGDWLLDDRTSEDRGTLVMLRLHPASTHTTQGVFDHYATNRDDFAFNKTIVALSLAGPEPLVSRSQARRVVAQLDQFREVVLNFAGVESIGPAFADEVFRVFWGRNRDMMLIPINANEDVQRLIMRATRTPAGTGTNATEG